MRKALHYSILLLLTVCSLCSCDYLGWKEHPECHKIIVFENKSDQELFVDAIIPAGWESYSYLFNYCTIGALDRSFINAGDITEEALRISQFEWGKVNYWEWEINRSECGCVYIMIADAAKTRLRILKAKTDHDYYDSSEKWPEEAEDSPLLAIYRLSVDDLNTLGWHISYPPDAAIPPECIIQKE